MLEGACWVVDGVAGAQAAKMIAIRIRAASCGRALTRLALTRFAGRKFLGSGRVADAADAAAECFSRTRIAGKLDVLSGVNLAVIGFIDRCAHAQLGAVGQRDNRIGRQNAHAFAAVFVLPNNIAADRRARENPAT